ncbi:hypothetical protein [Saccharomonospora iraqiensis]|uniref:hypothetical protein n=1 Tax=Saccharomonospora iraqiensis TaxID=52698 RepID=UPI0003FD8A3A|nr:hypothetical protein [Saccharomonospora iraqiensis]
MRIRTDDEIYRVDAVWLGPPKATFPWRARYVAWGVGIPLFLVVLAVERQIGIGFGFFSTAWAFVITIALTRVITSKISHERPLGAVLTMWMRELHAPRERRAGTGGAAGASRVRVRTERPRPRDGHRRRARKDPAPPSPAAPPSDSPPRARRRPPATLGR